MADMITVFNQLTQTELADSSLFEDVMQNHFEKFKYFYAVMQVLSLKLVDKIVCSTATTQLVISINFEKKGDREKFSESFRNSLLDCPSCLNKYFSVNVTTTGKKLNISIENKSISREDEIYEDRPNTR